MRIFRKSHVFEYYILNYFQQIIETTYCLKNTFKYSIFKNGYFKINFGT